MVKDKLAFATRLRYTYVAAIFLDVCFEAGLFSCWCSVLDELCDKLLDGFLVFLQNGSDAITAPGSNFRKSSSDMWLIPVAQGISQSPYVKSSFTNTYAALKRFFTSATNCALEARQRLALEGKDVLDMTDSELAKAPWLPPIYRESILLASLVSQSADESEPGSLVPRLRGLPQQDTHGEDFPIAYLPALLDAATSKRDAALWALVGCVGLRPSEARNTHRDDIDMAARRVWVRDPEARRFSRDLSRQDAIRFKGRAVSETLILPGYEDLLFQTLDAYLTQEFVDYFSLDDPPYLLQYIESARRGRPFVDARDDTIDEAFKTACRRIAVPHPCHRKRWSLYALRHTYAMYLLNDLKMSIEDVQVCMGHYNIKNTAVYARLRLSEVKERARVASGSRTQHSRGRDD